MNEQPEISQAEEFQDTEPVSGKFGKRKKIFVITVAGCLAGLLAYLLIYFLGTGVNAYVRKGDELLKEKRYREALTFYENALQKNPKSVKALTSMGFALDSLGQSEKAIEYLDRALKIKPRLFRAWSYKGNALYAMGDLEQALQCYEESLRLNPRYPGAWANKASVLRKLKRYEEANVAFQRYIELVARKLKFTLTYEIVDQIINRVIPLIEEAAGLRFKKKVVFRLVSPDYLGAVAEKRISTQLKNANPGFSQKQIDMQAKSFSEFYEEIIPEIYEFLEGELFIVPDNFQRDIILLKPEREKIETLLTILLVHDLVHALDDQHYAISRRILNLRSQDEMDAFESIVEGHALFITRRVAEKLGFKEEDFLTGCKLSGGDLGKNSPFDYTATQYISTRFRQIYLGGEEFVKFVFEKEGKTGISRLFSSPPFAMSVILDPPSYYQKVLLTQEDYIGVLSVLERIIPRDGEWQKRAGRLNEMDLRAGLSVGLSPEEIEDALKGFKEGFTVSYLKKNVAMISTSIFRFREDRDAVSFLNAEEKSIRNKWERVKSSPGVAVKVLQDKKIEIPLADRATVKEVIFTPGPARTIYNLSIIAIYKNFLVEMGSVQYKIENESAIDLISTLFRNLGAKLKGRTY